MLNKTDTLLACVAELGARYVIGTDPFETERLAWRMRWEEYARAGEVTQTALGCFRPGLPRPGRSGPRRAGVAVARRLVRSRVPAYANGWYQGRATRRYRRPRPRRGRTRLPRTQGRSVRRGKRRARPRRARLAVDLVAAVRDAVGPDVADHGRDARPVHRGDRGHSRASPRAVPSGVDRGARPAPAPAPLCARCGPGRHLPIATGERVHAIAGIPRTLRGRHDRHRPGRSHPFRRAHRDEQLAGWADAYGLLHGSAQRLRPGRYGGEPAPRGRRANYKVLEHFNDFADAWVQDVVAGAPTVDAADGCFARPSAPGLGVRLLPEEAAAHPRTRPHLNLVAHGWERRGTPDHPPQDRVDLGRM